MKYFVCLLALAITGCVNPQIVQMSPDTYMLTREDHGGVFGNPSRMKADVIAEASAFAMKQGKVAIPLSSNATPAYPLHFATFEYQFRVVDPNDPEAQRTSLEPRANIVVERRDTTRPAAQLSPEKNKLNDDLYNDLVKLDDLRKKKIITTAEFEARKKKMLGD
ncbi:MAG: SHOCT domain-containing protein [Proteobacteria bacterium]|nr:MAG: SHOCT domain-containing protein [Pseudomonadota bacterium]